MTEITFQDSSIQTAGSLPEVGTRAPEFTVTKTDLSEIKLKNYLGKPIVLNIFPSLDTSTCATAMKKFNEIAKQFPNILILCISADLPFAQKRFCAAEHLNNVQPVSVFRHTQFGEDYGVTITNGPLAGLLSRAVIVLNESGTIVYIEQVPEITDEPNYSAITKVLSTKQ